MIKNGLQCARIIKGVLPYVFCFLFLIFFIPAAKADISMNALVDNVYYGGSTAEYNFGILELSDNVKYIVGTIASENAGFDLQNWCITGGGSGWQDWDGLNNGGLGLTACDDEYAGIKKIMWSGNTDGMQLFVYDFTDYATSTIQPRMYRYAGTSGYWAASIYEIIGDDELFDFDYALGYATAFFANPFSSSTSAMTTFEFGIYTQSSGLLYDWQPVSGDYFEELQVANEHRDSTGSWLIPAMSEEFSISPTLSALRGGLLQLSFPNTSTPTSTPTSTTANLTIARIDCCVGMECNVPINFTSDLDQAELRISIDQTVCSTYSEPYDSYTLDYYAGTPTNITLPALDIGRHYICAQVDGTSANFGSVYSVNYYASTTNPYCIAKTLPIAQFDCTNLPICQTATSTPDFWLTAACILSSVGCILFQPSDGSLSFVGEQLNVIKTKFPASLFFNITDSMEAGLTSTSTQWWYLGIPMYSTTTHSYYILPIITSSSVPNVIGIDNTNTLKISIITFFWFLVAAYIILRLRKK